MNNPFSNPAFSMTALTAAINILPNRYGRLEELNLMPSKPVRQRQIVVEEMNGVLNLLPTLPPGSPGTVGVRGKRKMRSFVVPHIPHDDVVLPEEVNGIRGFMPLSQADLYRIEKPEQLVGSKLKVQVVELDPQERNLIVSHRAIQEAERQRKAVEVGQGQLRQHQVVGCAGCGGLPQRHQRIPAARRAIGGQAPAVQVAQQHLLLGRVLADNQRAQRRQRGGRACPSRRARQAKARGKPEG